MKPTGYYVYQSGDGRTWWVEADRVPSLSILQQLVRGHIEVVRKTPGLFNGEHVTMIVNEDGGRYRCNRIAEALLEHRQHCGGDVVILVGIDLE